MREGEASRTAGYMALFRALEHVRPASARRISDPFARAFVDSRLRAVVTLGALPGVGGLVRGYIDRRWPGARTSAVARTRFIDERSEAAITSGIEQIVLLGAGFDSRPYRLQGCDRITVLRWTIRTRKRGSDDSSARFPRVFVSCPSTSTGSRSKPRCKPRATTATARHSSSGKA